MPKEKGKHKPKKRDVMDDLRELAGSKAVGPELRTLCMSVMTEINTLRVSLAKANDEIRELESKTGWK